MQELYRLDLADKRLVVETIDSYPSLWLLDHRIIMKPAVFFKTVLQCLAAASFFVASSIFLIGIAMLAMFGGTGYMVVNMMRYISGIVSLYGLVFGLIASLVMATSAEYADIEG